MRALPFILAAMTCVAPLSAAAPPTTSPAGRFIDGETVVAVEADPGKLDAAAAARLAVEVNVAIAADDRGVFERGRIDIDAGSAIWLRWIHDFRAAAPGSTIVCVSKHSWLVDGGFAVYVPLPKDVPPGPLEGLFATGEPKPPASQPVTNERGVPIVRTYPGNIVGYWGGATAEPPPRPFNRPDFAGAFAAMDAAAAAPIRIAIAPDRRIRDRLDRNRSMLELPFHLADWLAVTCDLKPGGTAVLYEKHETFGDWRLVGFADGRVEVVYDEARFKQLLGQR